VFQNDELKDHLEASFSVESQSAVVAEWNMNVPGNILKMGNYRYRENSTLFNAIPNSFDINDATKSYTGATDADITVASGFKEDGFTPQLFTYPKDKEKQLYSLEECLAPFRPRSGINKLSYFPGKYLPFENRNMYLRPRYYMPTKDDQFKYWRSYRTESDPLVGNNIEYGISKNSPNNNYVIEDCNPFVAYKEPVPANRIVLKVQTNIGSINLGPFKTFASTSFEDPFFGEQNKTVPERFRIQYLTPNNQWVDAYEFNESTTRDDDGTTPVFGPDGYLSIEYGIEIPSEYKNNFFYVGVLKSEALLPKQNFIGNAYLILNTPNSKGVLKIWNGFDYDERTPIYKWFIGTDGTYENTHFVTDFTNPSFYNEIESNEKVYREFVWVKGVRLVVETMSLPGIPLELIEISPRLVANMSENLIGFDVTKAASDLSGSALPVGQIMAGVGSVSFFDSDNSFNPNNEWNFETNTGSIIAKHINKNIKFVFYEVIKRVNNNNYYVPIKTMYSETFPNRDARTGETSLNLRDFYFHFEDLQAPRILITEASLSQAVCLLLDSIGFSNYVFKRLSEESDPVIPYFFIPPDQSVAETLAGLARATQSAMFFDEFNNFVVATKKYLLYESPTDSLTLEERTIDTTLRGSDLVVNGKTIKPANIISIDSKDKKVYNSGTINYTSRYIDRTGGTIQQTKFVDKKYIYKPSLLWEVAGTENTRSANDGKSERFALSAVPLNTNLSDQVPTVSADGVLVNNVFDIGENAYWLTRNQGFFYSNGEVIRYDAVQFSVSGIDDLVWISNRLEYQRYFTQIPFNGKMYPTGLVRIYAEPFFETLEGVTITEENQELNETKNVRLKPGAVAAHGRGQFGTTPVSHIAGLDPYWTSQESIQGCEMNSSLLYTTELPENRPTPTTSTTGTAGLSGSITLTARGSQRHGLIRNFLSSSFSSETNLSQPKTTETGVVQSSALVMTGPSFAPELNARDYVSYVHKKLDGAYKHFGTRVRIVGKVESAGDTIQSVIGGMSYYTTDSPLDPTDKITVGGGSAGINIVNPETNIGYYFEIAALTAGNIENLLKKPEGREEATQSIENILFYKIEKDSPGALFAGTPTSVKVTAINNPTSLSYRVIGGTAPTAGTVLNPTATKASDGGSVSLGARGIVQSITSPEGFPSVWDVRLTGLTSTSGISVDDSLSATTGVENRAIPIRLWGGVGNIIVDEGTFAGQSRVSGEENPTVYDLAIEYQDVGTSRNFYLYINNVLVQIVSDPKPLPLVNQSVGLFVRGPSKAMFENVYALSKNYATNTVFDEEGTPIANVFASSSNNTVSATQALRKYAMSGVVQKTYLSGIKPDGVRDYSMYFEEFGSIMREAAYFNIKYDRAYPALYAKLAPTLNRIKGFTVSGFTADSYGAEFLIFNHTDAALNLSEKNQNYLRILGIAFTQNTTNSLTVDDYLKKRGSLSDLELSGSGVVESPFKFTQQYEKVKQSRILYGKNDFTLDSIYIQDQDSAEDILGWIIEKNIRPRKSVGLRIFSMPILQLGDLVNISYKDNDGIDLVSSESVKYVVYNISYTKSVSGPEMTVYLSEV
jgi:hypothetical protein